MKHYHLTFLTALCGLFLLVVGCGAGASDELHLDLGDGVAMDVLKTPNGLWWGKFEITQEQWEAVVRRGSPVNRDRDIAPDKPVYLVTFDDVDEFLRKLNQLPAVRRKGLLFRLPDKAEWDAACLAGSSGPWPRMKDGSAGSLDRMAWYNKDDGRPVETHSVGLKEPNAYGLFDMLGNVSELTTTEYEEPTWEGGTNRGRWSAGGNVETAATAPDEVFGYWFEDGARSGRGVTEDGRYMYCGFRVCASGSGYVPPAKSPVVKKDPFHVLGNAGASGKEQPRQAASAAAEPQGANGMPRTAVPEPLVRPGEALTDEKILEIARKKSDQLLAVGDIAGARKALEDAKALVELRNEPSPEEKRQRAEAEAAERAEQEARMREAEEERLRIEQERLAKEQEERALQKEAEGLKQLNESIENFRLSVLPIVHAADAAEYFRRVHNYEATGDLQAAQELRSKAKKFQEYQTEFHALDRARCEGIASEARRLKGQLQSFTVATDNSRPGPLNDWGMLSPTGRLKFDINAVLDTLEEFLSVLEKLKKAETDKERDAVCRDYPFRFQRWNSPIILKRKP